jgi:hypothetical protein
MRKILLGLVATLFLHELPAQGVLGKIKKTINTDSIKKQIPVSGSQNQGTLSNEEVIAGLRDALSVAAKKTTGMLNKNDGYFADAAIKILMPDEAKEVEKTLRKFGMSSYVDKAILSMNRAAEDAAGGADSIFLSAIRNMTIEDGISILKGKDDAATNFLRKSTYDELSRKMRPVIGASLKKVDATKYWKDVFTQYNRFMKNDVNPDLEEYVTNKALDGLFHKISLEEKNIRKNPAARVTDIMKKVFSSF